MLKAGQNESIGKIYLLEPEQGELSLSKPRGFKDKYINFTREISDESMEKLYIAILIQALQDLVKDDSELAPAENELNRYYSKLYFSSDCELYNKTCQLFNFDPEILLDIANNQQSKICNIIKRLRALLGEI